MIPPGLSSLSLPASLASIRMAMQAMTCAWYRDAAGYQIISRSTPGEPIDAPWQDIRDGMPR